MNATNDTSSRNATKRLLALVVLSLTAAALLASCGSLTSYAAKVNGQRITQNELDRELNAILGNKTYLEQVEQGSGQARGAGQDTLSTVFVARVLERRIAFELIHQEVEKKKLEVTPKDLEEARAEILASVDNDEKILGGFPESYRDELVRSTAEVTVLERSLVQTPKDEAAVKAFYEAQKASFETFCLRGILVSERAQADGVRTRVSAGADFGAIAKAESKDNQGPDGGSAAKGGDLGCIPRSSLGNFEGAVGGLQPGQVSEPIQTPPGFLLFQVTERKAKSLQEAAPEIRQRLEQQSTEGLRGFVNDAMMKAKITLNPRYGEFVQSGPEIGIKPPTELTSTTLAPDVAP
ncbi:MAG: peptidyl-prolyl cis-trans isomerase [Actinomycetota bacterium]|nr:peptidyl-prolyl cis-trans isomerase [Actinomycetota bacterium]